MVSSMGAGGGMGWSLKEADVFLRNPQTERCPTGGVASWEYFKKSISWNFKRGFEMVPESWGLRSTWSKPTFCDKPVDDENL